MGWFGRPGVAMVATAPALMATIRRTPVAAMMVSLICYSAWSLSSCLLAS